MSLRVALLSSLLVPLSLMPVPGAAAPVVLNFSATVSEAYGDITDGSISPGTTATGSLSYDSSTPAASNPDPNHSYYDFSSPPWTLTMNVGSYAFSATDMIEIVVADFAPPGDSADVFQAGGLSVDPGPIQGETPGAWFGLVLVDLSNEVLDSTSLVDVPLESTAWGTRELSISIFSDLGEFSAIVTIDTLTQVPEPAATLLVALGLSLVSFARVWRG